MAILPDFKYQYEVKKRKRISGASGIYVFNIYLLVAEVSTSIHVAGIHVEEFCIRPFYTANTQRINSYLQASNFVLDFYSIRMPGARHLA